MTKQAPRVKHRSEIAAAMHETMRGMRRLGLVDKQTMRKSGELCLTPAESLAPEEIHAPRQREGVSQNVFARYLNVGKSSLANGNAGRRRRRGHR
jgi:putative transcriptional regulator